jgi:GT2 family glycosyltransferase
MTPPVVSIVLPTFNGARTLPAVLDGISRQQVDFSTELVAVDSSSTDGTFELLRGQVDRLISIEPEDFNHGLTRNLAIEQTKGELIVLLVQDAVPASDRWLAELAKPLLVDAQVAGSFARQRPYPDASSIVRHYVERWTAGSDVARTTALSSESALRALEPMAQLELCTFDNVCSCIRRTVWERHPFRSTAIAEDIEWAREVLLAGYRLSYVPRAEVIHSHDRSARYEFVRTYNLHRRLYELFRLRTIPTLPLLARAIVSSLAVHRGCLVRAAHAEPRRRAVTLAVAWPLGQYLGALAGMRGWKPIRARVA